MKPIFIVGFMGAGKSTFGKKLATKLKIEFLDLDQHIASVNGFNYLAEYINTKGLSTFRQVESELLKSLPNKPMVVATGGGTPCYFDNMIWMKQAGLVIYLKLDEGFLISRLKQSDLSKRPLLKDKSPDEITDYVHVLLKERAPFFEDAHITFYPQTDDLDALVKQIKVYLKNN
jgi:shikimate kinase